MASTSPKPKKGILKSSNSIDQSKKELEWDEMNILATHHPPDKDYGFMKVDEPPTPYNKASLSDVEDEEHLERKGSVEGLKGLDPADLASRLAAGSNRANKMFEEEEDEESEDETELSEEEKARKKVFKMKRKMHYNEFQAVQLAKKLMAEDKDEEDEDDGDLATTSGCCTGSSSSPKKEGNAQNNAIDNPSISEEPEESATD